MKQFKAWEYSQHITPYVLLDFDLVVEALDPGWYWMVRKDMDSKSTAAC